MTIYKPNENKTEYEIVFYTTMLAETPPENWLTRKLIVNKLEKLLGERPPLDTSCATIFLRPLFKPVSNYSFQNANSETSQVRPSSNAVKGSFLETPPSLTPANNFPKPELRPKPVIP